MSAAHIKRLVRDHLTPPGTLRHAVARRVWRGVRSLGSTAIAQRVLATIQNRKSDAAIAAEVARLHGRCRGETYVFLPSVPWTMHLFQRPQHLARHLALAGATVVYDCSGTNEAIDGLVQIEPNLFLYKGPAKHLAALPKLVLWAFTYNYPERLIYPPDTRIVYDWIDDLAVFPYDQRMLREKHERALADATVVCSVARILHESARAIRPDAVYLPNAVETERFASPPERPLADPAIQDWLAGGAPIAGYYGALASWFDADLLDAVAARRPDWNFLLIGPDYDGSLPGHRLLKRANVRWIGPRPYIELPAYLAAMTCALIPFQINDITLATSPLKLYEYLAGGKPVITTPMPECMAHAEVRIVDGVDAFSSVLDAAKRDANDPECVARFRAAGRANSWEARAEMIGLCLKSLNRGRVVAA